MTMHEAIEDAVRDYFQEKRGVEMCKPERLQELRAKPAKMHEPPEALRWLDVELSNLEIAGWMVVALAVIGLFGWLIWSTP